MVDRALAWVNDNLDEFSPLTGERRFDMQRMKRFLELAVMITSCTTSPRDHEAALAKPVALLTTSLDQRGFVDWMVRYPSTLVQYLHIFTAYKSATNADHHHTTLLHRALESGFEEHIERAPHRVMEARMALDWAGLADDIPSWEELLQNSIAGRLPSSLVIRDDAIYALTHVVMFATRYGIDGPERLRATDLPRLAHLLEDLMIPMCQERHWDLVGELLFSWDCLQLPQSPVVDRAWTAFLDAQENDGSFPPPPAALKERPRWAGQAFTSGGRTRGQWIEAFCAALPHGSRRHHRRVLSCTETQSLLRLIPERSGGTGRQRMMTIDHLDVSSMEESARSWTDALFQRVRDEPPSDAQPLCELIVGVHLCNALAPEEQSAARSATIQDVASFMEQQYGADAFATVAQTMKLLTATLLQAYRDQGYLSRPLSGPERQDPRRAERGSGYRHHARAYGKTGAPLWRGN